MSFSEEQLTSRLNSLDETQESIVSASKWLLSQYKEAPLVAKCWKKYVLKNSTNTRRRLLSIYLANDVIQQSKHKRIVQFSEAFGKILPEVFGVVYPELPQDLRKKVRRVIDVWKQRNVFPGTVLDNMYAQLKDEPSSSSKDSRNLSTSTVPELKNISKLYEQLVKTQGNATTIKLRFEKSFEALNPHSVVYRENYKTVAKIGQATKDTLTKSIELRKKAITELKNLLDLQSKLLQEEEGTISDINDMIASKDPLATQQTSSQDEDILPTYERDDDSDSEGSSDDDSDEDSDSKQEKSPSKRASSEHSGQPQLKKSKTSPSPEENNESQPGTTDEGYDPTASAPADASEAAAAVTSSIQDLLSKLAN